MILQLSCGSFLLVAAVALAVLGFLLDPLVLSPMVNQQLNDQLAIKPETQNKETYNNWVNNRNVTMHPPEYATFHVFNLTNADDVLHYGGVPSVTRVGPFVYRVWRQKYNVEFSADSSSVSFSEVKNFEFQRDLSAMDESTMLYGVNLAYTGTTQLQLHLHSAYCGSDSTSSMGCPDSMLLNGLCKSPTYAKYQICPVHFRSVAETIWGYDSGIPKLTQIDAYVDPVTPLFFNCSSPDTCDKLKEKHFFGFGGTCTGISVLHRAACAPAGRGVQQYTLATGAAIADFQRVGQYEKFYGNSTVSLSYSQPIEIAMVPDLPDEENAVSGTDGLQFHSGVKDNEQLHVFDDDLMRRVNLVYVSAFKYMGINVLRFKPDIFEKAPNGMINATNLGWIRYGVGIPVFISEPLMKFVSAETRALVNCSNCDVTSDSVSSDNSYVDIEPHTGKVIRGRRRAQINAHLGNADTWGRPDFNCAKITPSKCPHNGMRETFIPVLEYEVGSGVEDTQANLLRPVANLLDTVTFIGANATFIGLSVGAILAFIGGVMVVGALRKRVPAAATATGTSYTPLDR